MVAIDFPTPLVLISNLVEGSLTSAPPAAASTKMPDGGAVFSCAWAMTPSVPATAMTDTNDATRMLCMEPPLSRQPLQPDVLHPARRDASPVEALPLSLRSRTTLAHLPCLAAALPARRSPPWAHA